MFLEYSSGDGIVLGLQYMGHGGEIVGYFLAGILHLNRAEATLYTVLQQGPNRILLAHLV